ncbi:hypothetical protein HK102_012096 [Quaeritorhiza haematococci]|nr:hypothetical protein HK102_012096 [Quaeritorhiza haematococci]
MKADGKDDCKVPRKGSTTCVNCGKTGHMFRTCSNPITSFGIIAIGRYSRPDHLGTVEPIEPVEGLVYKDNFVVRTEVPEPDSLLYLMIQRKDTMGYINFIRGKYPDPRTRDGITLLKTYFDKMTYVEIQRIKDWTFRQIRDALWINRSGACYVREFEYAHHK